MVERRALARALAGRRMLAAELAASGAWPEARVSAGAPLAEWAAS